MRVVLEGNGDTRGNPSPVVDRRTGRVVLMSTFNPGGDDTVRRPFVQYSGDNGVTWPAAHSLADQVWRPEWDSWYATGPGHAIQLEEGPHAGRLVVGGNHEGGQGRLLLSVDGGAASTVDAPDGSVTTGQEFGIDGVHIGQRLDGRDRFQGLIDEPRIYARALTTNELDQERNQNVSPDGSLRLWLPLDEVRPAAQ